jgi:hypothetical protein
LRASRSRPARLSSTESSEAGDAGELAHVQGHAHGGVPGADDVDRAAGDAILEDLQARDDAGVVHAVGEEGDLLHRRGELDDRLRRADEAAGDRCGADPVGRTARDRALDGAVLEPGARGERDAGKLAGDGGASDQVVEVDDASGRRHDADARQVRRGKRCRSQSDGSESHDPPPR